MGIYDGLLRVYRNLHLVHMNIRLVHMNLRLVHMNALCFSSNLIDFFFCGRIERNEQIHKRGKGTSACHRNLKNRNTKWQLKGRQSSDDYDGYDDNDGNNGDDDDNLDSDDNSRCS